MDKNAKTARVAIKNAQSVFFYPEPGQTDTVCEADPSSCMTAKKGQEFYIRESRLVKMSDSPGPHQFQNFYAVDVGNGAIKWVNASQVSFPPDLDAAWNAANPLKKPCGLHNSNLLTGQSQSSELSSVTTAEALQKSKEGSAKIADQLSPYMGACMLSPPRNKAPKIPESMSPFEKVADYWKKSNVNVNGPDGKPLSKPQLEAIDALARTLYGEMGICDSDGSGEVGQENSLGLGYLSAVAAVASNRVRHIELFPNERKRPIADVDPSPDRLNMTDVLLSSSQFSCWNRTELVSPKKAAEGSECGEKASYRSSAKKSPKPRHVTGANSAHGGRVAIPNRSLTHVLCPPAHEDEPFFCGEKAGPAYSQVWKDALRIATEAVLYPKEFAAKTSAIKDVYYYTSGHDHFYNFERVKDPRVAGVKLTDRDVNGRRCMELWRDPNPKASGFDDDQKFRPTEATDDQDDPSE